MSTRTAASRPTILLAALSALALSLLWVMSPVLAEHDTPGPAVVPTEEEFPGGDPICPEGSVGVRFGSGDLSSGTTKGHVTITNVDVDGGTFDFEADAGFLVSYVFAKGSTPQNVYDYSGFPGGGVAHDDGLVTPINDSSGNPAGISHIDFCVVEGEEESAPESAEQSVADSAEESVPESEEESGEQTVQAGTGTPEESTADSSLFGVGSSPLATIAFSLILLASLGALAYANVKSVRS